MLPSQRTLRLMAAINEGNSNNVRLEAWFGNTTTRMVFDVLDHLCVWAGCDVCPPPSLSSPAAIGGISHRRRKQKLGNCRSPCACLASGFASENRAGGLRLYWQVPLLVVRARTASCYLLWVRTETLGFATTDGMVRETHGWRDLVLQVGCPTSAFCCLCLSLLSLLAPSARTWWTSVEPRTLPTAWASLRARCTLVCFSLSLHLLSDHLAGTSPPSKSNVQRFDFQAAARRHSVSRCFLFLLTSC